MPLAWLPYQDAAEAERRLGGIPPSITVDVYRDGGNTLPDTIGEVAFLMLPHVRGHKALEPIAQMHELRAVQSVAAGFDEYLPWIPENVTFCSAAGVNDASVSEMAVGLALASNRRLPDLVRNMDRAHYEPYWPSTSLADRTVMIVGYGRIGHAIDARLQAFETSIIRVDTEAQAGPPEVHAVGELHDLLPEAEVVILVAPLTPQTHHMIGKAELDLMPDDSLLINVGRGALVDTDAVVDVLSTGRIRAALDVLETEPLPSDSPLWTQPGLLITPHVAGQSSAFAPRLDRLLKEQLERFAAGRPLLNVIPHGKPTATA